jgi:hypothetical protein
VAQTLWVCQTQVSGRGVQATMAEQQLDGAQVGAVLKQMHREGVA